MKTIIILSVVCAFFALSTIFLIWYVRSILSKLLYISESIGDFVVVLDNYANHLDTVYNMETYYGDETLQSLVEHTKVVVEEIEYFESIYTLTTTIEEDEEEEEDFEEKAEEIGNDAEAQA